MSILHKKILYVITKSNFGGAQRYVFDLATHIAQNDFEVLVACGGNGVLIDKLHDAGIKTHIIENFERDINIRKELKALRELFILIQSYRPDIIHLNSSKAGGSGALIARMLGVPKIIFTAHGWPFFEKRNFLWRALVWFLSYVTTFLTHHTIVVSGHDYVNARMPLLRKKILYIPIGIENIPFKNREESRRVLFGEKCITTQKDNMWVVSTGEHTKNKNLFSLVRAVALCNKKNTKKIFLILIGSGEDTPALRTYVDKNGMGEYVSFPGFIENVRLYLKAFDIFVIPSYKEGLPYALLEAGLARLPCIGSDVGGIPEIITHRKTGLLINPTDVDSLVGALDELTSKPKVKDLYGTLLHEKVIHDFSQEKMFQKTTALYEDLQ